MTNNKLNGRDAENFHAIKDISDYFGEKAVKDLDDFIENFYLPQSKYSTMFTLQEDVVMILDEFWKKELKAYLKEIKEELKLKSSDYKFTTEKQIAHNLRSLGFELLRDKKGNFVEYNLHQLEKWRERYLSDSQTLQTLPKQSNSSQFGIGIIKESMLIRDDNLITDVEESAVDSGSKGSKDEDGV